MNQEQYNHCVDAYSDGLFRFALKNLKNTDDAKEIVQSSFEKLWIRRKEVDFERVKSYLFKTAYHAMVDMWRAAERTGELTPDMENRSVTQQKEYTGLKQLLEKALNQLPELQKSLVLLRDYEGYSYQEIGEVTGLNESQVKVYLFRARQTLKTIIGSLEAVI